MSEEPSPGRLVDGLLGDKDQAPDQPAVPEPATASPPIDTSVGALAYDSGGELLGTFTPEWGVTVTMSFCVPDTTRMLEEMSDCGISDCEMSDDSMFLSDDVDYSEFRTFEPLAEDRSPDFGSEEDTL